MFKHLNSNKFKKRLKLSVDAKMILIDDSEFPLPSSSSDNSIYIEERDESFLEQFRNMEQGTTIDLDKSNVEKLKHNISLSDSKQNSVDCSSNINFLQELGHWAVENNVTHKSLSSLTKILRKHTCFSDFPKDSRTILNTPRKTSSRVVEPGQYVHFGVSAILISECLQLKTSSLPSFIKLHFNVDGLPIAKSSKSQLWIILGKIINIEGSSIFIVGAYHGNEKPASSNAFLKDFVEEMRGLVGGGINIGGKRFSIQVCGMICDAPARAFIASIKYHTGFSSCGKCTQEGEHDNRKLYFPDLISPLRTDESFRNRLDEAHHNGSSILENIPGFGMVSMIPYEYMHLVCLGVVKKLFNFWLRGPLQVRLSSSQVIQLSKNLLEMRANIVCEFARKPRAIKEFDRFKATEFRQILLYTGPVVLIKILPGHLYEHFLSLHCAISVLCNSDVLEERVKKVEKLLVYFVQVFIEHYGNTNVSYNVHGLLHLCEDVRNFGPLDSFSAFPYENFMRKIKSYIRKNDKPLQQLSCRITEASFYQSNSSAKQDTTLILKQEHMNGPVLQSVPKQATQYRVAVFKKFVLKTDAPNNVCMLHDNSVMIVDNFIAVNAHEYFIGRKFKNINNLYLKPWPSSSLKIFKVSNLGSYELVSLKKDTK